MKPRTLVIATMAWTTGIVGCTDEQCSIGAFSLQNGTAVVDGKGVKPKPTASFENQEVVSPVPKPVAGGARKEPQYSVPIYVGGERIENGRMPETPSENVSFPVMPSESKA